MSERQHDPRSGRENGHLSTRRRFLRDVGIGSAVIGVGLVAGRVDDRAAASASTRRLPARLQGAGSGELTFASARALVTFDPRLVQTTEEMGLMQHVCEPLVGLDAKMNIVPRLAKTWEAVDPTTWRFTLQPGVTFHNGEPFDAAAVKFSLEEFGRVGEKYPWYYLWTEGLPTVEVVDPATVLMKSSKPIASLPRNLALMYMLPPKATAAASFGDHPIGTGPYQFVEHQKDVRLVLEANPSYWGPKPTIGRIVFRPIPDPSARLVAIQNGEVQVAASIPPDLVPALRQSADVTVAQVPGVRIAHYPIDFRRTNSPIADVRVRQAMTYAIDGKTIIDTILAGAGQPLQGPVPSILFAAADLGGYPAFNPDRAKTLLQQAGYPSDQQLTLIFSPGEFIKDREVTEAVVAQLSDVGVNIKMDELEEGAYQQRRTTNDWDIAINGFSTMNGDPAFFLAWATGPTTFGYANQQVKDLVAKALETPDDKQRSSVLQQAEKLYWADVPYLWGYTQTDTIAIRKEVSGVTPLSTGWVLFQTATIAG